MKYLIITALLMLTHHSSIGQNLDEDRVMRVQSMLHSLVFDEITISQRMEDPNTYLLATDKQKAHLLDSLFSYADCAEILLRMNAVPANTRPYVESTSFMKELSSGKIHIHVGFHLIHDDRSLDVIVDEMIKKRLEREATNKN